MGNIPQRGRRGVRVGQDQAGQSPSICLPSLVVNRELLREIKNYEDRLGEESWLTRQVSPLAQLVLSRVFGMGNEKVYLGRGDWLFYRPEIEYLTGPGFLDARQLARRAASGNVWKAPQQPDPVQTIVRFHAQLAAQGIDLVLVPAPGKASVHPGHFTDSFAHDTAVLHNRSYRTFLRALEAKGIRVFDPTDRLAAFARKHGASSYLATDTHWTPAAMESVAVSPRQRTPSAPAARARRCCIPARNGRGHAPGRPRQGA